MSNQTQPTPAGGNRRRTFMVCGERFVLPKDTLDLIFHIGTVLFEKGILLLGPLLIIFASLIIGGLAHTFFTIVIPMMKDKYESEGGDNHGVLIIGTNTAFVVFLLVEIIFNYYMCVTTRNGGENHQKVSRELAKVTGFVYPETPQEVETFRRDYEHKMHIRITKQRQAFMAEKSNSDDTTNVKNRKSQSNSSNPSNSSGQKPEKIRNWMLMAPDEWGYCHRSKQPKPPRSHYDHVTKSLVICFDHYCPWMFNSIGYFNYRYFCNFLWFTEMAMMYGAFITFEPFQNTTGVQYRMQRDAARKTHVFKRLFPMTPFFHEKTAITLSFMLCLSIGIALALLGGFHLFLCCTGQTTIEFHANWMNSRKAKRLNKKYKNPYDMGIRRNWQQIYGSSYWLAAFLIPSRREPEFLPLPLPENEGRRKIFNNKEYQEVATTDDHETSGDIV